VFYSLFGVHVGLYANLAFRPSWVGE